MPFGLLFSMEREFLVQVGQKFSTRICVMTVFIGIERMTESTRPGVNMPAILTESDSIGTFSGVCGMAEKVNFSPIDLSSCYLQGRKQTSFIPVRSTLIDRTIRTGFMSCLAKFFDCGIVLVEFTLSAFIRTNPTSLHTYSASICVQRYKNRSVVPNIFL